MILSVHKNSIMIANEYCIEAEISSSPQYLTELHKGVLYSNDNPIVELPKIVSCRSEWGEDVDRFYTDNECYEIPDTLMLTYLSYSECKFYTVKAQLSQTTVEEFCNKYGTNVTLLIGMAPFGEVAVWVCNTGKSVVVDWLKGNEKVVSMNDFFPLNPNLNISKYCEFYNKQNLSIRQGNLPDRKPHQHQFDKYMQKFTYRYLPLFEKWVDKDDEKWQKYDEDDKVIPEFEYIEEILYDGTYDKLHDGGLLKYHEAGKPKKLAVKWHVKKSEYMAYFWFEDEEICAIYDRFYGAHRDTKTDFIIHIDPEKNKYELALYRYGLKAPQVIAESAYQLIVFKNKFEYYRSENYDQPRGAWIW